MQALQSTTSEVVIVYMQVVSGSVVVTFAVQTRNLTVVEKQIEELVGHSMTNSFS